MFKRNFLILASVTILTFAAAEARRGFSSGGSGSGAYNNAAPTAWNVDSTLDADCQNLYGKACSELTKGQYEEVQSKNKTATDNNYGSDSDYQTANGKGYTLSADDGTQWTDAKSPGADNSDSDSAWNSDCDSSFSSTGGCDALSKANFASIDDASTGRLAATTAGYSSYKDWQGASALSYGMTGADATLWGEANDGSVSSAACDAEFAGKACNQLAKASFQNAKSSNALMTAKIAKVTAGTLTGQDLTDLSISFSGSALSSPVSAWQLDYLETVLGTSGSTTKANWQATIDGYNAATASAWYIWKIAASSDSSGTYAASKANYALFNAANVDSGLSGLNGVCATGGSVSSGKACATLGVTNTQIAANIRTAGFTAAPSATAMRDFLTEAAGFADGTSYANVATATGNGWSKANYKTASNSTGWSSSSADATKFTACVSSANSTDGSGGCGMTLAEWNALAAVESIAADDNPDYSTVTSTQFASIITAGSSATANLNLTGNTMHLNYMRSCVDGLSSKTAANIAGCSTSSTATTSAALYGLDNWTSSYTLDDDLLEDAGLSAADADLYANSTANSCFGKTCKQMVTDYLSSSGNTISGSSTAAQVEAALDAAFDAHYTTKANAVTAVTSSNAPSGNSCALVTTAAPSLCSHQPSSHIYCTVHTSNFSINSAYDTISYDGSTAALGATTVKNYTIKYKSRRSNTVLRTETRKLKIVKATSNQSTAWQVVQNNNTCTNARNACVNAGGTVGTKSDLGSNNSMFASGDYVLATDGSDHYWNKYYSCHTTPCETLGGSNYLKKACSSGTSFANLKVICNKPICN